MPRVRACSCACHRVYVCVKQEMEQGRGGRGAVSEGKIQQDIKGAERFRGREGKGKSDGPVELEVGWWWVC